MTRNDSSRVPLMPCRIAAVSSLMRGPSAFISMPKAENDFTQIRGAKIAVAIERLKDVFRKVQGLPLVNTSLMRRRSQNWSPKLRQ